MSDRELTAASPQAEARFHSLESMKAGHSSLLDDFRQEGESASLAGQIVAFLQKAKETGAVLDSDAERQTAQSFLDYWAAMLYRLGQDTPDSILGDFDPQLAPELADELNPYQGLDAFLEDDRQYFFGRQALVDKMVASLRENRLLIVVGPSGSGKSSAVLAGLLPELKAGALEGSAGWRIFPRFVPGTHPLVNLARAIAPAGSAETGRLQEPAARLKADPGSLAWLLSVDSTEPAVLVVDQFEETFTLCFDVEEREAFIEALLRLANAPNARHVVVLTMRTDFESQVARVPRLLQIFEQSHVRVTAMNPAELRQAITRPADLVGLKFEEGLVDDLVSEILGEPAALPLLQFTLLKLWENRQRNRITWEAYRRLGGGREALARSADALFESLIPEEQITARHILLQLALPGEGLEITSNRIRRERLYQAGEAPDRVDRVLKRLIDARLVRLTEGQRPEDTQVEVAHEALIRNWPRLANWLDEERVAMRQRRRLTAQAEQWRGLERDPSALLRGAVLEQALAYEDLDDLEQAYVQASVEARDAILRAEELAQQRELERAQRLTRFLGWVAFLAFLMSVASILILIFVFTPIFRGQDPSGVWTGIVLCFQPVLGIITIALILYGLARFVRRSSGSAEPLQDEVQPPLPPP